MRAALLLVLLTASGVNAADLTLEERLRKLEQQVETLQRDNDQLRHALGLQAASHQKDVKMNGRAEQLHLGGIVQVQGEAGSRPDTRFSTANDRVFLRRARINVSGRFVEGFDFRAELELAGSLSNASGLRAQMTDGYVNWNRFDLANVRMGQFKTPFGFEQLYADPRLLTAERSLVTDRLTAGRQAGVELAGRWQGHRIDYALGFFNGNGTNTNFNDNARFLTAGRFSAVPFEGLWIGHPLRWSIGVDGLQTRDRNVTVAPELGLRSNLFTGRRAAIGIDSQIALGRLEVWGEALRARYEPDGSREFVARGAYGQVAYYLVADKLQIVGRRETFDGTRTSTLGLNYYFKQHDLKLQFDVLHGRGTKVLARMQTAF